jgi:hypothetical protein
MKKAFTLTAIVFAAALSAQAFAASQNSEPSLDKVSSMKSTLTRDAVRAETAAARAAGALELTHKDSSKFIDMSKSLRARADVQAEALAAARNSAAKNEPGRV